MPGGFAGAASGPLAARPAFKGSTRADVVASTGIAAGVATVGAIGAAVVAVTGTFTYTANPLSAWAIRARRVPDISISEGTGEATSAQFEVGPEGTVPEIGQAVTLDFGEGDLITGVILTLVRSFQEESVNTTWNITVTDYRWELNRRRPFGSWPVDKNGKAQYPADDIAIEILQTYAPSITYSGVQRGLPKISLELDGTADIASVLTDIAEEIGGSFRLNGTDVALYIMDLVDQPEELNETTNTTLVKFPELRVTEDGSQLRTKVLVRSAEVAKVARETLAGRSEIPVIGTHALPATGYIYSGGQVLEYDRISGTLVTADDEDHPAPVGQSLPFQSASLNGVAYPAGNYFIAVSLKYPDGYETLVNISARVTLDGVHALAIANLPTSSDPDATRVIYISEESSGMEEGTVGVIGEIPQPGTTADPLVMTPALGANGTLKVVWHPDNNTNLVATASTYLGQDTQTRTVTFGLPGIILDGVGPERSENYMPPGLNIIGALNIVHKMGADVSVTLDGSQYGILRTVGANIVLNQSSSGGFASDDYINFYDFGSSHGVLGGLTRESIQYTYPNYEVGILYGIHTLLAGAPLSFTAQAFVQNGDAPPPPPVHTTTATASGWSSYVVANYTLLSWGGSLPKATVRAGATRLKVKDPSIFKPSGRVQVGDAIVPYELVDDVLVVPPLECPVPAGTPIRPTGCSDASVPTYPTDDPDVTTAPGSDGYIHLVSPLPKTIRLDAPVHLVVIVNDYEAQEEAAEREGEVSPGVPSTGVHEYVLDAPEFFKVSDLRLRGVAELQVFSRPIKTIAYDTYDAKSAVGKVVPSKMPGAIGNFLIQSVDLSDVHVDGSEDQPPRLSVTATSVRFTTHDLMQRVLAGAV